MDGEKCGLTKTQNKAVIKKRDVGLFRKEGENGKVYMFMYLYI